MPLRLADGRRVMVEAYHPAGSIDAASRRIWRTFLPIPVALLIALAAAQLPLGWYHTRRERAEAVERERLARVAERSLRAERGRIATEVHRGVVQELAGVAYQLQAAAITPAGETSDAELRGLLRRGAAVCRRTMTVMRELLADEQPPAADAPDVGGRARGARRAAAERAASRWWSRCPPTCRRTARASSSRSRARRSATSSAARARSVLRSPPRTAR